MDYGVYILFQPIKIVKTDGIKQAECLIGHKQYQPVEIIAELEKMGVENYLDQYMLERALKTLGGKDLQDVELFVNLCKKTPEMPDQIARLIEAIDSTRMNGRVVIEVNENTDFIKPEVLRTIDMFKEAGIRVALDDFHSDLWSAAGKLLQKFDIVKVDIMELNREKNRSGQGAATIYEKLKFFGHYLIAEGVETNEDFEWLKGLGVDAMQGWHIGKKYTLEEFQTLYLTA